MWDCKSGFIENRSAWGQCCNNHDENRTLDWETGHDGRPIPRQLAHACTGRNVCACRVASGGAPHFGSICPPCNTRPNHQLLSLPYKVAFGLIVPIRRTRSNRAARALFDQQSHWKLASELLPQIKSFLSGTCRRRDVWVQELPAVETRAQPSWLYEELDRAVSHAC